MLEKSSCGMPAVRSEFHVEQTTMSSSGCSKRIRVWGGEKSSGDTHHRSQDIPGEQLHTLV